MIVADTTLVASAVITGNWTRAAAEARVRDKQWIAPRLLRSELLSALAKYVVVAKTLERDDAVRAFRRGLALVALNEDESDPIELFNTVERSGLTTYDAEFVILARRRNLRLVTLDGGILRACPDVAISIQDFIRGR
jgi:predicted nucleic acid-binding protein